MKRNQISILLAFIGFCLLVIPAQAKPTASISIDGRDPRVEQGILDRLQKINPEAIPLFIEATKAMDGGDYTTARQKFEAVLKLAPDFPDALRRLGDVLIELKENDLGITYLRKAVEVDNSNLNKNALVIGLLSLSIPESDMEAYNLSKGIVSQDTSDITYLISAIYSSLRVNEVKFAKEVKNTLLEKYPDEWIAHYMAALVSMADSDWSGIDRELQNAKNLGAPGDVIDEIYNDPGLSIHFAINRGIRWGGYGLAGWVILLGILFIVGTSLSKLTIKTVKEQINSGVSEITPAERLIRRLYKGVITAASAYFYLSIPILILVVILSVLLCAYVFLQIGHIPIRIALIILIVAVLTLFSIIRSLFIRTAKGDPGKPMEKSEAPELWKLVQDVGSRLSTRPIDKIFITPDSSIAVFERGNWWKKINNRGERCLLLGLGALTDLTQGEFQSIVAHEYGHFINADTAGGTLANRVGINILTMAISMGKSGAATWYNPVWWFLKLFNNVFTRITHGAMRLQEIQADRLAVRNFGIGNFKNGLERIIRQSIEFKYQVDLSLRLAQENNTNLNNIYVRRQIENIGEMEAEVRKALTEPTSPYDSHPAPKERFELINSVIGRGVSMEDNRLMWDLIPAAEKWQIEMTKTAEDSFRRSGYLPAK